MARTCSECTYMPLSSEHEYNNDGRFWCEYKCEFIYANSAECEHFCRAYNRDSSVARSYASYSETKQRNNNSCYITTIVCEILKFSDDNAVLNTLRNFRNNILQKDEKYKELLVNYDIVGPMIADKLLQDPNKIAIAQILFTTCLIDIAQLIDNKEYTNAIKEYTRITLLLINRYNINKIPSEIEIKNADLENSGHGYYVKKLKK